MNFPHALAFALAIGEYGSIVFIWGNRPFKTEIAPYLIVMRLEEYDYKGAIALVGEVSKFLRRSRLRLRCSGPVNCYELPANVANERIPECKSDCSG